MRKPSLTAALLATGTIFLATAASALAAYAPTLTRQPERRQDDDPRHVSQDRRLDGGDQHLVAVAPRR